MALVNIMGWVKRRKIFSVDQILNALAISKFTLLWSLIACLLVSSIYATLIISGKVMRIIKISWTVTNHFTIWFATCLRIFYFLKIANFSSYIHTHPIHCVSDIVNVSPAHFLPVETSEEHGAQRQRLQRCQHHRPHKGLENCGHLPVTVYDFLSISSFTMLEC